MSNYARVLAMIEDLDGCALWRCLLPITELQRQGYKDIEWDSHKNPLVSYLFHAAWWKDHQYDAVILPRKHWALKDQWMADRWFNSLHAANISVIYEIDDDLFSEDFERRLIAHRGYDKAKARERRGSIMNTISRCDGMTVSTQRLATMASQYVDIPVKVVPNYIDLNWFKQIQKRSQRDSNLTGITGGGGGGWRLDSDLEDMAKAWGILAKKYPQVTFVVMGHHAQLFYDILPHERIATIDWMPIDQYPAGLVNIDIGCCPLADHTFNRAKTPIKALEYAASSAAVVASPTVYNQLIDHGENGYIAESVDDWVKYLSALIEDYRHRHDIAKALLAKVRKHHSLESHVWRWLHAWTEIVDEHRSKKVGRILLPPGVEIHANAARG